MTEEECDDSTWRALRLAHEIVTIGTELGEIIEGWDNEDLERILTIYKAKMIDMRASLLTEKEWPTSASSPSTASASASRDAEQ